MSENRSRISRKYTTIMKSNAAVLQEPVDADDLAEAAPAAIETIDVEEPQGDEVLVEIGASSLCHTDVAITRGHLEESFPLVMGHEGAGIVREVGPDVESVEEGAHVVLGRIACGRCEYCRIGRSNLCNERTKARKRGTIRSGAIRFNQDGQKLHHCHGVSSFSEYTVVSEEVAIEITDELPLRQATLLGCGVFTGAGAVMNTADIEPGASVAVFGVGGVGASAIQAAELRGATEIIAVDLVDDRLSLAESMGATRTINPGDDDTVELLRDWSGGGLDYAFDAAGNPTVIEQAVDSLRPTGTAVLVGTPPIGKQDVSLDIYDVVVSEKSLLGSFNGSYNLADAIPRLAELAADGRFDLEALISDERSLNEVNKAMGALETGGGLRQLIIP
ncbi:zinc-binding dehydrogenase [Saliphagus sp. GCM10025334]